MARVIKGPWTLITVESECIVILPCVSGAAGAALAYRDETASGADSGGKSMTAAHAARRAGERVRRAARFGCAAITVGALVGIAAVAAAGHPSGG
jgi:hypothetical protein